jgi:sugar lactone lactonase YvrE
VSDDLSIVLTDRAYLEGPRWHDDRIWVSDFYRHEVVSLTEDGQDLRVEADVPHQPSGLDWLPDGRLLIVPKNSSPDRRLLRQEPDGTVVPHADLTGLPSGFNELVVDGRGNVYVNGADFDFLSFMKTLDRTDQTPLHERPGFVPGYIALITPDGTARQVAGDIAFPNGMVVTPDNRTLIISESFAGCLTAFDIVEDGGLSNRRRWAEGLGPDGITMDRDGAIWTSNGATAAIRVREGGEILDRVELDRWPFALMLGGDTLFIMAARWNPQDPFGGERTGQVLTVPAPAPAAGWPGSRR